MRAKNQWIVKTGQWLSQDIKHPLVVALLFGLMTYLKWPVVWFAYIMLAFVGMAYQRRQVFQVLGAFFLLPCVLLYWQWGDQIPILYVITLGQVMLTSFLVVSVILIMRYTKSWRMVVELLSLVLLVAVAICHMMVPDIAGFWMHAMVQMMKMLQPNVQTQELMEGFKDMASVATGLRMVFIGVIVIINVLIGYMWMGTCTQDKNIRSVLGQFYELRAGWMMLVITAIILLLAKYMHLAVFQDMAPVLVLPYLLCGVSLYHYISARYGWKWFVNWGFYILLVLLAPRMPLMVAFFGLIDTVVNIRQRFDKKGVKA